jgi:hypothetical protein
MGRSGGPPLLTNLDLASSCTKARMLSYFASMQCARTNPSTSAAGADAIATGGRRLTNDCVSDALWRPGIERFIDEQR